MWQTIVLLWGLCDENNNVELGRRSHSELRQAPQTIIMIMNTAQYFSRLFILEIQHYSPAMIIEGIFHS